MKIPYPAADCKAIDAENDDYTPKHWNFVEARIIIEHDRESSSGRNLKQAAQPILRGIKETK